MSLFNPRKPKSPEAVSKQLTRRYVVALALIAMLATTAFSTLFLSIQREEDAATVINVAGRQRMLSQRITLFVNLARENPNDASYLDEAEKAVALFETSHNGLLNGDETLGLPGVVGRPAQAIYYGETALDRRCRRFIELTKGVIVSARTTGAMPPQMIDEINETATGPLLVSLDQAVKSFERESTIAIERLEIIETIVYLFTLALLAFEAAFIFRPAVKRVASAIADLMAAETRLREAAEDRKLVLDAVGHELRTPLNAMTHALASFVPETMKERDRGLLQMIAKGCDDILDSVTAVLNFVSLETHTYTPKASPVDIGDLIDQVIRLEGGPASTKGLRIYSLWKDEEMPRNTTLMLDRELLITILRKLVHNAIRYTEEGRVIVELSLNDETSELERSLAVTVRDTGCGIPKGQIEDLFKPFQSAAREGSGARGMGLGLPYVKTALAQMGGSIKVQSHEGVGSAFTFTLPAVVAAAPSISAAVNEAEPSPTPKALRCLIAEDNPVNQIILTKILREDGHQVQVVANGKQAVDLASQQRFDAILLDIVMPEMRGDEACKMIRDKETARMPRLIAVTANALPEDIEHYHAVGFDAVVPKPIEKLVLQEALAQQA